MTWQNTPKSANFYCSSVHDLLFADALKTPQIPSTQISPIPKRLLLNPLLPPYCAPHCPKPSTKVPWESEPSLHLAAADWQTQTQTQRILTISQFFCYQLTVFPIWRSTLPRNAKR